MKGIGKLVLAATLISGLLNGIVFLGTVIALLKQYVGVLAYVLWIPAAPILSPGALILPWFSAWVDGSSLNERILWTWASFYICLVLRVIFWKWDPIDAL